MEIKIITNVTDKTKYRYSIENTVTFLSNVVIISDALFLFFLF
jgi:hypothetical protein